MVQTTGSSQIFISFPLPLIHYNFSTLALLFLLQSACSFPETDLDLAMLASLPAFGPHLFSKRSCCPRVTVYSVPGMFSS